jgi:HEAT repeat protein
MRFVLTGLLALSICAVTAVEGAEVRDLIAKLGKKDSDVRRAAAKELGELGSEAKEAVPALTKALRDRDVFVRRFAAEALGNIGPDAKEAVGKLTLATKDERKEVSLAAVEALGKMGTAAVPALQTTLKDSTRDPQVRGKAAAGLGKIGTGARSALKTLTEVLTGKIDNGSKVKGKKKKGKGPNDDDIRIEVALALGEVANAEDGAAVAALRSLAEGKQKNKALKKAAGDSYRKITGMEPKKKKKKQN